LTGAVASIDQRSLPRRATADLRIVTRSRLLLDVFHLGRNVGSGHHSGTLVAAAAPAVSWRSRRLIAEAERMQS
jgi:hypothetical protein